jgi:hypothetical protein
MVSDFYTPHYFEPVAANGVRYSYSGQIHVPRQVLDGGYLSWFDPETRHLFQLRVDGKKRSILDQGEVPPEFNSLRAYADSVSTDRRDAILRCDSRRGLMLSADVDYRRKPDSLRHKPNLVDESRVAGAGNLRAQIDRICSAGRLNHKGQPRKESARFK